jgi:NTE family protein
MGIASVQYMGGKTALVLSAGGMFASYQAGVWKAIAGVFRPDMVIGASAGALNAWVIVGGGSAEQLITHWNDPEYADLLRLRTPPIPWRGVFDAGRFESRVEKLYQGYSPRIPVGVVMLQLAGLRPRLVRGNEITWRHLAASCSIPVLLPPQPVDGMAYVDGGLLNVLPLWAAREMGATRIVAVNVLPSNPSMMFRLMARLLHGFCKPAPSTFDDVRVIHIVPSVPLGPLRHSVLWQRDRIERWIELGYRDGLSITMRLDGQLSDLPHEGSSAPALPGGATRLRDR